MRLFVNVIVIALSLIAPAAVQADPIKLGDSRLALIDDPMRVEFVDETGKLTVEGMQRAIAIGATAKNWRILKETDGRVELTTTVRNRHRVHVEVLFDAKNFEIRYLDSDDVLYAEKKIDRESLRVIHHNYNVWIRDLTTAMANNVRATSSTRTIAGVPDPLPKPSNFATADNVDAVPYLKNKGREAYKKIADRSGPRAFAIAPNGAFGGATRDPRARLAMERCNRSGQGKCKLYLLDDAVVWTE